MCSVGFLPRNAGPRPTDMPSLGTGTVWAALPQDLNQDGPGSWGWLRPPLTLDSSKPGLSLQGAFPARPRLWLSCCTCQAGCPHRLDFAFLHSQAGGFLTLAPGCPCPYLPVANLRNPKMGEGLVMLLKEQMGSHHRRPVLAWCLQSLSLTCSKHLAGEGQVERTDNSAPSTFCLLTPGSASFHRLLKGLVQRRTLG